MSASIAASSSSNPGFDRLLTAFGLTELKSSLVRSFRVTDAFIGGSAALTWHMGDEYFPDQDLDIFYTPTHIAPQHVTKQLFDNVFSAAGYNLCSDSTGDIDYRVARRLYIDVVHNWFHPVLKRKIQLIVRSDDAPRDCPAYAESDFDICQFYAKYDLHVNDLVLRYNTTKITPAIADEIRTKRVMRIGNLKGCQELGSNLRRLHKYYYRGFAFEGEREAPCSCACGHAHTAKKVVRLSYDEAAAIVRSEYYRVNFPSHPGF